MKRLGKILGLLGGALLLLGATGLAALNWLVDPNDYKAQLQSLARERAGLALVLEGDIGWRFLPRPTLRVRGIRAGALVQPGQTPQQPLAELDSLSLTVQWWPLLRRQIEIRDFRAEGLTLPQWLPPQGGRAVTLSARGQLLFDAKTQTLEWNALRLGLRLGKNEDEAELHGQLVWTQLAARRSASKISNVSLSLQGDRLDLDRYLPRKNQTEDTQGEAVKGVAIREAAAASTPSRWGDSPILPAALPAALSRLDMQLDVSLAHLILKQTALEDVRLQFDKKGGLLSLQTLAGRLAGAEEGTGGSFALQGDWNMGQQPAQNPLNADIRLNDVPLGTLMGLMGLAQPATTQATAPATPPLSGTLTLTSTLRTRGNSPKVWVENLNGNARWALANGVIPGANLDQHLCQGIALLNRKRLRNTARHADTRFEALGGHLHINRGVADNPDLLARLAGTVGLTLNGEGKIDLRTLTLDYRLGLVIAGDTAPDPDPACSVHPRYVGLALPLRCEGELAVAARACNVDRDALGEIALRLVNQISGNVNRKIEEKLGEVLKPELRDTLKGLLKR